MRPSSAAQPACKQIKMAMGSGKVSSSAAQSAPRTDALLQQLQQLGHFPNRYKRPTSEQHREENAQKDIAMGSQTPIESYILGHSDKENNNKGKERRAPLHIPGKS